MTTLPRLARVDAPLSRSATGQDAGDPVAEEATGARQPVPFPSGLFGSSLARRILLVNLALMAALVGLALLMNPFRDTLTAQRQQGLMTEARLMTDLIAGSLGPGTSPVAGISQALSGIRPAPDAEVFVFGADGGLLARAAGERVPVAGAAPAFGADVEGPGDLPGDPVALQAQPAGALALSLAQAAKNGATVTGRSRDPETGATILAVATPLPPGNAATEMVVVTAATFENAWLQGHNVRRLLMIGAAAIALSIAFSLGLAASITGPLSALASAAEQGRDRHARKMTRGRVRIPDLAERSDEIGHLSKAMRGMVAALYDRIDANEQFAADVAHEIKNPLASLRAAVGALRGTPREDQRDRLLDVIEHDVRRLDRLVSDISNASRLDSDLVREDSVHFNLLRTLGNLGEHLGRQAAEAGVEFITDLPPEPILIEGLEGRLAQVFVNLVTNAISFCDEGDAVRLWARRRENRVLVVVEDTGPGIPEAALGKVFDRFYSERPDLDFGNHSGLGLAISKQIVEAHGGVIWAENIRPTHADITSEPLGARFVVGLPV